MMMKLLTRIIAVVLFVIFFGFAVENTQEVSLHLFWHYEIHGPLVLLLLAFFALGAVLAVLAMTPTVFRHRRDLSKHKKTIADMRQESLTRALRANQSQADGMPIK